MIVKLAKICLRVDVEDGTTLCRTARAPPHNLSAPPILSRIEEVSGGMMVVGVVEVHLLPLN